MLKLGIWTPKHVFKINCTPTLPGYIVKSTYAKVHGSVSVDALQRKEAEESACGKVHDPTLKITDFVFRKNYYVTFW